MRLTAGLKIVATGIAICGVRAQTAGNASPATATEKPGKPTTAPPPPANQPCLDKIKEQKETQYWHDLHKGDIDQKRKTMRNLPGVDKKAKNIIMFIANGMNIDSVTAGRIYQGKESGEGCGEEHKTTIDKMTFTGMSKTYTNDKQVPSSWDAGTALFTGIKQSKKEFCYKNKVIYKLLKKERTTPASRADFRVGLVTDTGHHRGTLASSYTCLKKKGGKQMTRQERSEHIKTEFARHFKTNGNLDLYLGGGRQYLHEGLRTTGDGIAYAANFADVPESFDASHHAIIGAFADKDFPFVNEEISKGVAGTKKRDSENIPSLAAMTTKAVNLLKTGNKKGFFLAVEAGLIDRAHKRNQGPRAIQEVNELDLALKAAQESVADIKDDTLIIVTSNYGHAFTFGSYGERGSYPWANAPVGGITSMISTGNAHHTMAGYLNGPGGDPPRVKNAADCTEHYSGKNKEVLEAVSWQPVASPSGEDVPIYGQGPFAHLLTGTHDQSFIAHVMQYASCVHSAIKHLPAEARVHCT